VDYDTANARGREFGKIGTTRQEVAKLLDVRRPDRLVIEAGGPSGWVSDVAKERKIAVQVANVNDSRWQWKRVKKKSDREDALKMAQMSELGCLPTVHMPDAKARQWRSLIEYRHGLVDRRTAMKNSIRALYDRQGIAICSGDHLWTKAGLADLARDAREPASAPADELWRLQLHCELKQLEAVQLQIAQVEQTLAEVSKSRKEVQLLKTAPYVGPRLSEAVVAILDDPKRFKNGREVGCYAGLTPRLMQSGESDRQGHISHQGNGLLRELLVEISWLGVRSDPWMKQVYENVRRGSDKRKKIAIVAVARRLLVRLWAMWRDGTEWKAPIPTAGSGVDVGMT
jgi:transposase